MTSIVHIDPRIKRTRQLLQHAFTELMQEKGFSEISIQDIAERATVNRATFYAHFENKYQLLDCLIREQIRQIFASHLSQMSRWEERTLRIVIRMVLEYIQETQNHYCSSVKTLNPMIERAVQEELFDLLMTLLTQSAASEPAPSATRELLALPTGCATRLQN
jgi:AcrR family transcriptional regulator